MAVETRIVILNGPRGSGKDAIAEALANKFTDMFHIKFSDLLKTVVADSVGADREVLDTPEMKLLPIKGDKSFVDLQIELFQFLKETYGPAVLGKFMVKQIHFVEKGMDPFLEAMTVISSDGGRREEIEEVAREFGADKVLIIQLYRDGKTFIGDIRTYVEIPGIQIMQIRNDSTLEEVVSRVESIMRLWIADNVAKDDLLN